MSESKSSTSRFGARSATLCAVVCLAIVVVLLFVLSQRPAKYVPAPMTFNGDSKNLKRTQIVATLDTPLQKGKNVIWCASFQSAWKALQTELAAEPIELAGGDRLVDLLNDARDVRPDIPADCLYTAVGWEDKGIINKIRTDLKHRFPQSQPPDFPDIEKNSFVAYSYLAANIKFSRPYFQNREPLVFTDDLGHKTNINSFGIRPEDEYAYFELRAQSRILFRKGGPRDSDLEFAIDLCASSSPSQIVVARIPRQKSLAAALARVKKGMAESEERKRNDPGLGAILEKVGPNDVLLVPDLFWRVSHRFTNLEGKTFKNRKLRGQRLDHAQQDIVFRLDRSGAELRSQAKLYCKPTPTHFVLDRPFMIYMKKRGAQSPYFLMWVDNAELLHKWHK